MREIPVTCALIIRGDKVLCTQRSEEMHLPGKWEFPGGKIEKGESPEECLVREIREELAIEIKVLDRLSPAFHSYNGKDTVRLLPFVCVWESGFIHLHEHQEYRWSDRMGLLELDWAKADLPIVSELIEKWNPIMRKLIYYSSNP